MPFPPAHPALLAALSDHGYLEPTAVQAAVLAPEAAGRDLLVSSRTGSGKTVAFGLTIAPDVLIEGRLEGPRALVVAPTRELAMQVQRELYWLFAGAGARVIACVGGMDARREQQLLRQGPHIVVGTPGRLCDHLDRGALDLSGLKTLVLDEGDEMLDLGFREELERLLGATPSDRRTLLFSATLPDTIVALARTWQNDPLRIAATAPNEAHADISWRAVLVNPRQVWNAVVNILRYEESPGALVFCTTRESVNHLYANLLERGFQVVALSGELTQAERNRALQALRDRKARVCVATDVAARGLDLPDLGLVVHADPPRDPATLLHRSGRTGRAGKKGTAVVVVPATRRRAVERVFQEARVDARWSPPPPADAIRAKDEARLHAEILASTAESLEEDVALARRLLAEREPEALVAALVRSARSSLPAPEELEALPPPEQPKDGGVWFRINVGRDRNADPRWLVPMLCRRGGIRREDIGRFRVFALETRVEIAPSAADRFAEAVRRPDRNDPGVRVERAEPRR